MRRRGFSLVELILAIFVLGIGMISVAALFPAGIRTSIRWVVPDCSRPIRR